jgi:hypothetical protein
MARVDSRRMHLLRAEFFEQGRRLDAAGDPAANCWICKQPIDYSVPANSSPDSHALDHYQPVATHPELQHDPTNFRHAHALCNSKRGKEAPSPGLGETVPAWW